MGLVEVQEVLQPVLADNVAVEHEERVTVVQQLTGQRQRPRRAQRLGFVGARDLDLVLFCIIIINYMSKMMSVRDTCQ